jgi:hypothetical protein
MVCIWRREIETKGRNRYHLGGYYNNTGRTVQMRNVSTITESSTGHMGMKDLMGFIGFFPE